jgi:hypothetical protein
VSVLSAGSILLRTSGSPKFLSNVSNIFFIVSFFLQSNICLDQSEVCDTKQDCPMGEDEKHCTALISHGYLVRLKEDGRPEKSVHGLVAYNHKGVWRALCTNHW